MADYSYILYDTQPTGTAAFDNLLFQTTQGADATHTEDFTNARGPGMLPNDEAFTANAIGLLFDPQIAAADLSKLSVASLLQVKLSDRVIFWSPLPPLFHDNNYQGFSNQTAAAGLFVTGHTGLAHILDIPIVIAGGQKFGIRIKTTQATAASTKLVCVLLGKLTLP